jgi:hypothetical protein
MDAPPPAASPLPPPPAATPLVQDVVRLAPDGPVGPDGLQPAPAAVVIDTSAQVPDAPPSAVIEQASLQVPLAPTTQDPSSQGIPTPGPGNLGPQSGTYVKSLFEAIRDNDITLNDAIMGLVQKPTTI